MLRIFFFKPGYKDIEKSIALIIHFLMICMFPNTCTLFHHSFSARELSHNAQDAIGWLSERPAIKDDTEKTLKQFYICIFFLYQTTFIYL